MHDYKGHTVHEGKCLYIRQSTSDCAITKMLHFQHSKNLPKHEKLNAQLAYI